MEKHLRLFLRSTLVLLTLGIGVQVSAQPEVVSEVPVNSTGFVRIGDLVYFNAGDELWRTDGTAGGTMLLKNGFGQLIYHTEFKGSLYFFNADNNELWKSDGTPSGTIRLHTSEGSGFVQIVGQTSDYLFFKAFETATGVELYRTDGTTGGTMLVKDINTGPGDGFVGYAATVGNDLFFGGVTEANGQELWKSDGTTGGTLMVKDIYPGANHGLGIRANVLAHNNLYYFAGNTAESGTEPWVSDGTAEGTYLLQDIVPQAESPASLEYRIAHNGTVYFLAHFLDDFATAELWRSDGTMESTARIKAVGYDTEYHSFLVYQDKVYFWNYVEPDNYLWVTDGTSEGTQNFFTVNTGDGTLHYFDVVNNLLLFTGSSQGYPIGFYRSDGTAAGTQRFTRFNAAGFYPDRTVGHIGVTTVNDLAFYADHDGPVDEGGYPINNADYFHLFQANGFTTESMRTLFGVSTAGTKDIIDFNGKVLFTTINDYDAPADRKMKIWIYDPEKPVEPTAHFTLVYADNDEDIKRLSDGDSFLIPYKRTINIRYNPVSTPGSVVFELNDAVVRTETAAPYSLAGDVGGDYAPWEGATPGTYKLTATPYSEAGGGGTAGEALTINFTIEDPDGGKILREYWAGVPGNKVSDIPLNTPPTSTGYRTLFEGPSNTGTNYGARYRGYVSPPTTGEYTFWIASNDHSELWLSTNENPENRVRIAYVEGATMPHQWTKFPSQKSAVISLTAGQRYYIEALHKQGVGTDHIAVGWQLPDGSLERPIPGSRLSPWALTENLSPVVTIESPVTGQTFYSPATINIRATASDPDGHITEVEFYQKRTGSGDDYIKIGEALTEPYDIVWSDVQPGNYFILAQATDNDGVWSDHEIMIEVTDQCNALGSISWEYWDGVQGARVSDIPLDSPPTRTGQLSNFEGPVNIGTNYGSRIRGYICAPVTGDFYFSISSNDHSELWLSTDDNPANKAKIAYITGATNFQQFDKYSSQHSVAIPLVQGKTYYIEALHKQGVGSDHITVAWTRPDTGFNYPIDGQYLSPFVSDNSAATARIGSTPDEDARFGEINVYPNPASSGNRDLSIAGFEGIEESVETDVQIINLMGDVVHSERIRCGGDCGTYLMRIDRQLVPGVYIVNMKTNGARFSKPLLVK